MRCIESRLSRSQFDWLTGGLCQFLIPISWPLDHAELLWSAKMIPGRSSSRY